MNEHQYYQTRIAYYSVLGFIFGALTLVPGIDSVGHTIAGVLTGFTLLFTAYSIFRMRRASTEVTVYTPATLHPAPRDTQLAVCLRARWIVPSGFGLLTIMAGFDFQRLNNGEVESVSIMVPFNFIYSAFGAMFTLYSMATCAIGSFFGIQWIIRRVASRGAAVSQQDTITPPSNNM